MNSGDRHHERETLGIGIWLFTTACLSFAIGSGFLALGALRTVHVVGIQSLMLFLKSRDALILTIERRTKE